MAINDKTSKGSVVDKMTKAMHIVSAFASEADIILEQLKIEGKSNEITAISNLLDLLDVSGVIAKES